MSKELVISAASHERRVAILEEGQLVEIYIEREKEFALVGSIYKGKVTRVLPGMQSAFVDIGLDGDAFLYVSDVFENLEDYDHDHAHEAPHAAAIETESHPAAAIEHEAESHSVELLPGESLAKAGVQPMRSEDSIVEVSDEPMARKTLRAGQHEDEHDQKTAAARKRMSSDARCSLSPKSASPNRMLPRRRISARTINLRKIIPRAAPADRGQNFDRGNDRGNDRGQDSGSNRGGGRFGRRGGRRRGGRPGTRAAAICRRRNMPRRKVSRQRCSRGLAWQ